MFWSLNQQQAENQAKETKNELHLAKQQSALEDGLSQLWTKLQRNRDQASRVKAQAESARRQAGGLEEVHPRLLPRADKQSFFEG